MAGVDEVLPHNSTQPTAIAALPAHAVIQYDHAVKFTHCLPAFHDMNTVVGLRSWSTQA